MHQPQEWLLRVSPSCLFIKVACSNKRVAEEARRVGFTQVFYAERSDLLGLANTLGEGILAVMVDIKNKGI